MGGILSWCIENPSKEFKKKYPKNFITISLSRDDIKNVDKLSDIPYFLDDIDYLFTYDKETYKTLSEGEVWDWDTRTDEPDIELIRAIPCDLSRFFIDAKDETDVILSITPQNIYKSPLLCQPIVVRLNHSFFETVDLKKSFNKIISNVYKKENFKNIKNTEDWLLHILNEPPVGLFGEPYKFGKVISDDLFKKEKFNFTIDDFIIGYNFRIPDIQEEFKCMQLIEKEFSNLNSDITIYNDYTNIIDKIEKACTEKNVKFKKYKDISITMSANDFYKLDIDYQIINFLQ